MGGTDMRPPPRALDSGHYEVASDAGGRRAAAMYSLIESAKLNGINPQHYLAGSTITRLPGSMNSCPGTGLALPSPIAPPLNWRLHRALTVERRDQHLLDISEEGLAG